MQANKIKKIKVKVKEKPWQFFITMCCFLLLSVLICGSILLQNLRVRKMSKEQQSVLMKETGALRDNMETEIHQLTEKLSEKEQNLTESGEMLKELSESYNTTIEKHLPGEMQKLTEHIAKLKEEISTSQSTIEKIEREIINNTDGTSEELTAAVSEMTEIIKLIEKDMGGSVSEIQSMLESLRDQNTKESEELSDKLSEVEKKISDKTTDGVSETSGLLNDFLDKCMAWNDDLGRQIDQKFSEQNNKMSENQQSVLAEMGNVKDTLGNSLGKLLTGSEAANNRLGTLVADSETANNRLGTLVADSEAANSRLGTLVAGSEAANSRLGTLVEDSETANNRLGTLVADSETANSRLGTLVEGSEAANSKLGALVTDTQNMSKDLGTLKDSSDTISGKLDNYRQDMEKANEATKGYFNSISALMGEDNSALLSQIGTLHEEHSAVKEEITAVKQELGTMTGTLSEVFQSVSNGKKNLASALLTKGITISEDASFEEIKNGILNVDQTLLLEEGSVQGKIDYEFHYHKDGSGNRVDVPMLSAVEGCFTMPVYHIHKGNPNTGGDCYETPVYHVHTGVTYKSGGCHTKDEKVIVDCHYEAQLAGSSFTVECPKCYSRMDLVVGSYDPETHSSYYVCRGENNGNVLGHYYALGCGKEEGDLDGYALSCGKEPGETIDGYGPGCGMSHGQITKATIIFDR